MTEADSPSRSRLHRLFHLGLFGLAVGAFGFWLAYLWLRRDDPSAWQRDWYCFYSAGESFVDAGAAGVYLEQCIENYFWLYPPYMLYPWAAASLLPPLVVYGLVALEVMAATALSLWFLAHALPGKRSFETLALLIVGSAAFFGTLVAGQHSALLLVGLAGALWAIYRDRRLAAGLFLGLLGIKPNWAAVFVAWLVVTRRWPELAGMAAVGILMLLSTLPMGFEVWTEYLVAGPRHVGVLLNTDVGTMTYPAHKLVTLEAFARSTVGALAPAAGRTLWIALELLAVAACLLVWLRSRDVRDQLAVTVLVAVAANIYVEYYDVLVLAVPAAVWWTGRGRYPSAIWKTVGAAAGAIWLWHWVWAVSSPGPGWPSLIGGILAVWIAAEAFRVGRGVESATIGAEDPLTGTPRS